MMYVTVSWILYCLWWPFFIEQLRPIWVEVGQLRGVVWHCSGIFGSKKKPLVEDVTDVPSIIWLSHSFKFE
jgi:hypothetical protein